MDIENLKKVVGFGLSVGEAVFEASSQPTALAKAASMLHLVEDVPVLFGVDYSALGGEIKSLTPDQLTELNTFIDAQFSIPDADKESKIEAAIALVIDLARVAEKAVAMWKPAPAPTEAPPPAA